MYDYKYLNGPILDGSYQNWVIQSALAPLRGLEAREKLILDFDQLKVQIHNNDKVL